MICAAISLFSRVCSMEEVVGGHASSSEKGTVNSFPFRFCTASFVEI